MSEKKYYNEYETLYESYKVFKQLLHMSMCNADEHYRSVCDIMTNRVNDSKVSYSDFDIVEEAVETKERLHNIYDIIASLDNKLREMV